eukprot:CAMPEP_0185574494 /NCGR_PEP_ID=MMETSP0434-20130131/5958_1 /TAXON_ID=626734 ORGANISM="Favella taraikaensis, Strain Fe Narragansett Bay" /NCGR_SAMPLE_ID=MMETSP0434 /ASSEMBLY_ACC=CAM_ASM_000379 /LENGTH=403 /DNA_ID=CAMNT_0028191099 /DNA_START=142 /DNA_END=1353 /DNA_ORIENTATION=+
MKHLKIIPVFLLLTCGSSLNVHGQILASEDFETDGEGVRYTTNFFQIACSDFFERMQLSDIPTNNCITNAPSGQSGTFFWGGEDTDQATGGEGVITLNSVSVAGYNLDVDVLMAHGRPSDGRCENSDYFILEYNMDGGGWNIFGAMYGNNDTAPFNGNLQEDTDLDGAYNAGAPEVNSTVFQNFNFSIPVVGNNVQIRIRMLMNAGTEETVFDNIRINGTSYLPVELVNFSAIKSDTEVELAWQTASELNNEGFNVLHTTNGKTWNTIDFVEGVGTTTEMNNYQVVHRDPSEGMNYYRLQQVDFDGQTSFSDVKSVRFEVAQAVTLIPNPSDGNFFVNLNPEIYENDVVIQLLDMQGAVVLEARKSIELNNTISIDGSNLNSGVYLVNVSDRTTSRMERIVIN